MFTKRRIRLESTDLLKKIGRIDKRYTGEKFNPFKALEYIYNFCLTEGSGSTVTVLGYSNLFRDNIVRAMHHVQRDKGILVEGDTPKYPNTLGEVQTHTGAYIRFINIKDVQDSQNRFTEICKDSSVVALCDSYSEPVLKNIIREQAAVRRIYDFSENNVKKDVDSSE